MRIAFSVKFFQYARGKMLLQRSRTIGDLSYRRGKTRHSADSCQQVAAFLLAGVALTGRLDSGWWSPYLHALVMWLGILALMGLGRRYLNFTNPVTRYLSASSFALYIFHQAWLVMLAFYAIRSIASPWLQAPTILGLSLACSLASYEACRRLALTRFLFGIKR